MIAFISISDALRLCYDKKGILIDVRPEEAYRAGHLPMAENVPLEQIQKRKDPATANAGEESGRMTEKEPERQAKGRAERLQEEELPLFFYCDTGVSSMLAARILSEEGRKAYSVAGGLASYRGYLEKEEKELWTMVYVDTVHQNQ